MNDDLATNAAIILIAIAVVWGLIIHFSLAFSDPEYAKHDQSLYAQVTYFQHGGWGPTALFAIGLLIWWGKRS